ncbi:Bug family tripartite tricarboxylate transporter substrate binding protein [Comamonas koreensis]|uniref:Tripartite tricarboxylate transporter substrate binding protein n=1 Tax=Comamonas koreensis TaxID=160825 RepID=A0AAW4Y1Z0_9BURK|nr:tripartite tricarboxylate transporter substrate binding protein [Comamonas koreensis]MCD2167416.1 tripartite tricarboxylate transporter substrate binding protein [Comamonas koreensis]
MKTKTTQHAMLRRQLTQGLALGLALGTGLVGTPALAQTAYPTKPVTLMVGFPPGGQTDFAARVISNSLAANLGQGVVIENKAGVNGNLGSADIMRSAPDGYRMLVGNGSMTVTPHVFPTLGIVDPTKFVPVGILLQSPLVLVVPAASPVKDFAQFAALVKERAKAGKGVDYGTPGAGSLVHVTTELMRERLGSPAMNHVPYKGSGPAVIDLMAGRIEAMFDATSVFDPYIKSGKVRAIMVTSSSRVASLPDVPTPAEVGLKDFEIISFIGMYGPPGTRPEVVQKLNAAINTVLKEPAVIRSFQERGDQPGGGTPEQLDAMTRAQYKLWGDVVKANKIHAE